ncbi:MAG: helix-turn-helix domain-containing protein [Deltaproteobacteria bacterium]|nr:helix-turn-helix domain-containing protein [Deltaproteobacteria bacterium]
MKKRKEFTLDERQNIDTKLYKGKGFKKLAEVLDRDPKVIKRVATRYKSKNPFVDKNQTALERAKWDHDEHQKEGDH